VTPIRQDEKVVPLGKGFRVRRDDGTSRVVLPRYDTGWAVFDASSTDQVRNPPLGYSGSWRQDLDEAIEWARTAS
jgi:hypothetical protein